jgi:NAD(P)-dependent dehydrogenase (short-subunit alcohol dehydrogenase family)
MLKGKTALVTGSTSGIGLGILASDAAPLITCAILPIDGGWTAH